MEEKIVMIINKMADYLNISQMKKVAGSAVTNIFRKHNTKEEVTNDEYLQLFFRCKTY